MLLRVQRLSDGPGPSEIVVGISTADGKVEEMIIDERAMQNQNVEIGYPISAKNGHMLVELPREAMSGRWRVWVENSQVDQA